MPWKLTYTPPGGGASVTKDLSDTGWGFTAWQYTRPSLGVGRITFEFPGSAVAAYPFAFKGTILIKKPDGTPFFTGTVLNPKRVGSGDEEYIQIEAADPWWWFTTTPYMQVYHVFKQWQDNDPSTGIKIFEDTPPNTHVILGVDADQNRETVKLTLRDILNWVISQGAPFQFDTNSLPDMNIPMRAEKDIMVDYAIRSQIALMDIYSWFDHTTSPPTFNLVRRSELTAAELDVLDPDRQISAAGIIPRYDLKVPYVQIFFEKTVNGELRQPGEVHYPAVLPASCNQALVSTITLLPFASTTLSVTLKTEAISIADVNWWKNEKKEMKDAVQYNNLALLGAPAPFQKTVETELVNALPRKLVDGNIPDWLTFQWARVECGAYFSYERQHATGSPPTKVANHLVKTRVRATNAPIGTNTFSKEIVSSVGEDISFYANLAQQIYNDLNTLAFDGTITIEEAEYTGAIGLGNTINILNGAAEWETMNAAISSVTEQFLENGGVITTIELGPPKHLTPGQLVDILRWNRTQYIYASLIDRSNGTGGSSSSGADISGNSALENMTEGPPRHSQQVISAAAGTNQTTTIQHDADNKQILMQVLDNTGAALPTFGQMEHKLSDLNGKKAKYRPWNVTVAGQAMVIYVDSTDSPDSIGGIAVQKLTLLFIGSDVLQCHTAVGDTVYVAKSTKLRNSIASETIEGSTIAYEYDATFIARTATSGGASEGQVIVPRYLAGDVIWAATIPSIDLAFIPGDPTVPCTLLDVNVDGRAWASSNFEFQ